ncbi:glycosyltransferase family 2 protein [Dryocola clanedunensis]|uniref:glycosyltransferase family 2 protein n=1 Tax=Cedecea sulfonylureivorans TaxID=3051154 RepID=UPI001928872A|nr:glycosyltransferase family 2 protein [Cedecea sulfonylureivorans]
MQNKVEFFKEKSDVAVDIVMATYNGEKFIAQQIESILAQDHDNFTIYISDDGSTDQTVEIIKSFSEYGSKIKIVNTERVGGVMKNFEKALTYSKADYIMLSDQDDVWYKNKIQTSLDCILKEENCASKKVPLMVYTDLELVDENLSLIDESFYHASGLNPYRNLIIDNLLWMNSVWGCTILLNRAALSTCLPFKYPLMMHDHWLAMNTLKNGKLVYIDKPLIKYRQHSSNVLGGVGYQQSFIKRLFDVKLYKNIISKAKTVSKMHQTNTTAKKIIFSKIIIRSIKNCETKKYPLIFLFFYLILG